MPVRLLMVTLRYPLPLPVCSLLVSFSLVLTAQNMSTCVYGTVLENIPLQARRRLR